MRPCREERFRQSVSGEPLAALAAAVANDGSSCARTHAGAKAVNLAPPAAVRLKCALHWSRRAVEAARLPGQFLGNAGRTAASGGFATEGPSWITRNERYRLPSSSSTRIRLLSLGLPAAASAVIVACYLGAPRPFSGVRADACRPLPKSRGRARPDSPRTPVCSCLVFVVCFLVFASFLFLRRPGCPLRRTYAIFRAFAASPFASYRRAAWRRGVSAPGRYGFLVFHTCA